MSFIVSICEFVARSIYSLSTLQSIPFLVSFTSFKRMKANQVLNGAIDQSSME